LKQPIDFNTVGDEVEGGGGIGGSAKPDPMEGLKYSDISSTLKSKADAIVQQFGEDCVVRMFDRRWHFREQGVKMFIEKLPSVFEEAANSSDGGIQQMLAVNASILQTLVEIYKDKVQQIVVLSFEAAEQYTHVLKEHVQITVRSDQGSFERMFTYLLDRMPDNKTLNKTKAAYLKFYEVSQFDVNYLTAFLFKPQSFINKSQSRSIAHISQRLKIVEGLLSPQSEDEGSTA
jgi:hypothetical protein